MNSLSFNLKEVDQKLGDNFWSPVDVAKFNNCVLRAAAFKGKFHWHKHNDDEFFLIHKGEIVIDTENGPIKLREGEGTVIPKGTQHRPRATKRAMVLLLEPEKVNARGE